MDSAKHFELILLVLHDSTPLTQILLFLLCLDQGKLLSISAAYGDLETVRYLLTERRVELPTEPTDDNPAVVAAHFGHTDVVQELLESLPGKSQGVSLVAASQDTLFLGIRQACGGFLLQMLVSSRFPQAGGPDIWGIEVTIQSQNCIAASGNTTSHVSIPLAQEVNVLMPYSIKNMDLCPFFTKNNRLYSLKQF